MQQTWQQLVSTPPAAAGTVLASFTAEAILIPNVTIYANQLVAGGAIKVWGYGAYGSTGTPTFTFAVRWGGVGGTVIAKSGALTTASGVGGGAAMTALFFFEFTIQCRTVVGAAGTAMTNGTITLFTTGTAGGTVYPLVSGATGGTTPVAVTIDTTADTALAITAACSASNAANSIRLDQQYVDSLN